MKITKILVALSFLFAVTTANAGEMTVTGNMETTFQKGSGVQTTGNPLGMDKELKFSASTELDNGITVSVMQDTNDSLTFGNSQIAFGNIMGLATVYVGSDSDPVDAIDDITPSAYEEANGSGSGTGYDDIGANAGQMGLGAKVTLPYLGAVNYKYYPKVDGNKPNDNSTSADANATVGDGESISIKTNFGELPGVGGALDGLVVTTGYAKQQLRRAAGSADAQELTMALNYAYGPVNVGVQRKHNNAGAAAGAEELQYNDTILGLAYAINDSLSISYNRYESKKKTNVAALTNATQKTDALNLGYTVGGLTIGVQSASTDNNNFILNEKDDTNTIGLSVAF